MMRFWSYESLFWTAIDFLMIKIIQIFIKESPSPKGGFQNSAVRTRCSITRQMNNTISKAHDSQDD